MNPRVRPCEPLCGLLRGGAASLPRGRDSEPLSGGFAEDFRDEGRSRIKGWRRYRRSAYLHLPAVRTVYEGFQRSRKWRLLDKVLQGLAS